MSKIGINHQLLNPRDTSEYIRQLLDIHVTTLEQKFEVKESKLKTDLDQQIRSEVRNGIDGEVKLRMKYAALFMAGFLVFVTLGMIQRDVFFKPVVQYVYPPADIYQKIEPEVESGVWKTMKTADRQRFEDVLGNGAFYPALLTTFRKNMIEEFGTVENRKKISAKSVSFFGEMSLPARISIVDGKYDGQQTKCNRVFSHARPQAIVVLPAEAGETDYRWLGCTSNYPEITELRLLVDGQVVEGIQLVGVEHSVSSNDIEVRVSADVAKLLSVSDARRLQKQGKFSVSKAED